MAEGTRLLSEYGVYSSIAGSNPALSVAERPANSRFVDRGPRGVSALWRRRWKRNGNIGRAGGVSRASVYRGFPGVAVPLRSTSGRQALACPGPGAARARCRRSRRVERPDRRARRGCLAWKPALARARSKVPVSGRKEQWPARDRRVPPGEERGRRPMWRSRRVDLVQRSSRCAHPTTRRFRGFREASECISCDSGGHDRPGPTLRAVNPQRTSADVSCAGTPGRFRGRGCCAAGCAWSTRRSAGTPSGWSCSPSPRSRPGRWRWRRSGSTR